MNALIVGAGASRATSGLPTAFTALAAWEADIRNNCPLLTFALEGWMGHDWPGKNLEEVWTRIDLAWKERAASATKFDVPDLSPAEREEVWRRGLTAAAAEPAASPYYGLQIQGARDQGHSTEQFLSVAAGWELRRLIQEKFVVPASDHAKEIYGELLRQARADAVISFNYDSGGCCGRPMSRCARSCSRPS